MLGRRVSLTLAGAALVAAYAAIWFIRRNYTGLDDDAHLYAFQAIARLQEYAAHDLFLKYGSQDDYTIFTPLFAWLVAQIGLAPAGALLSVVFHAWSIIAAWFIARRLMTAELAWLATGIVIVFPGEYGALGVFQYSESFLTARLPAEAFALTSIALLLASRYRLSLLALALALFTHPIMAAPAAVLMVLFRFPVLMQPRFLLAGAVLLIAMVLLALYSPMGPLAAMENDWLAVVRERSHYLFVDEWRSVDWDASLLPLLTLTFAAIATDDLRLRRLCAATVLVGAIGLALAAVTSFVVPIALLVKGQAWRWIWLSTYLAIIMLTLIVVTCWQTREPIRRASAVLLCAAWVPPIVWAFPLPIASPLAALSIAFLWQRKRIAQNYSKYVVTLAYCAAAIMLCTVLASASALLRLEFTSNKEPFALERARDVFALTVPAAMFVLATWFATIRTRRSLPVLVTGLAATIMLIILVPRAYAGWTTSSYKSSYESFADWRATIDHRRSVLWPQHMPAVWFLLDSPGYLSVSQTAGVVFSRETAMEAARRAAALEPLSGHTGFAIDREKKNNLGALTADAMRQICSDPELGYVVSAVELSIPHLDSPPGRWGGLHLYRCDSLKDAAP